MKNQELQKSIFQYFEDKLEFKFQTLDFRFPVETLGDLLRKFYKEFEQTAFLIQANKNFSSLNLKKISRSYLLSVPVPNNTNEHLYVGLSDSLSFLIMFDENPHAGSNNEPESKFFLSFDPAVIKTILNYFYRHYCDSLSLKEKKLLIKLKNVENVKLDPFYLSKFQEALLISVLNENNRIKQAKIIEALSFTDESIVITDLAGNIKKTNQNFKERFKHLGKNTVREILPEDLVDAALKETVQQQKWHTEVEISVSNNKKELLLVSSYLFKDDLNRPSGFVFTFKDVTELRKLDSLNKQLISKLRERNVQLNEVNKRLLEADRIKSDLLSVVSHELKTPVSTIIGFGELLANRENDEKEVKTYAEQITDSAKNLDRLITDYLDVASNQFGITSNKLHTAPVNLSHVLRAVYRDEIAKYKDARFDFELNCLGLEPVIITELVNVQKLFGNLISNSLKYSPDGGKIQIKILNDGERVTISVADEGVGLLPGQAKQVFEPFYRADNSITREFSGIGLGLAVCRKIVDLYNGSIWCEPGVDKGTVFYVMLPVNPHTVQQVLESEVKIKVDVQRQS